MQETVLKVSQICRKSWRKMQSQKEEKKDTGNDQNCAAQSRGGGSKTKSSRGADGGPITDERQKRVFFVSNGDSIFRKKNVFHRGR